MDSNGLHAQADAKTALAEREEIIEAGLQPVIQAELVEKQPPKTRVAFLRSLQQVERFAAVLGGAQMRA